MFVTGSLFLTILIFLSGYKYDLFGTIQRRKPGLKAMKNTTPLRMALRYLKKSTNIGMRTCIVNIIFHIHVYKKSVEATPRIYYVVSSNFIHRNRGKNDTQSHSNPEFDSARC